jgi:glycosyltransferase involved in cell wall biosynthesis
MSPPSHIDAVSLPSPIAGSERVASGAIAAPRRRICFISETLEAGVGRHVVDAAGALAARGHDVHLVYSPFRADPRMVDALQGRANLSLAAIPMPHALGLRDITAALRIGRYLRAAGPFDIIHGHSSKGGAYARLLKSVAGAAAVYSPHAFITMSPSKSGAARALYGGIEAILARMTDRIICVSALEQSHAMELGISQARLQVVPPGIAPPIRAARAEIRAKLGLAPHQVALGFIGRMVQQKAPERLIAAVTPLLPALPDLILVMIGEGPLRAPLEHQLREAGFSGRVRWLGAVDARDHMAGLDFLVISSLYEGFAYALIEALCYGLPVVTTPVGGVREAITSGVNGFVVSQGDAAEMAEAIRRLATDPTLRRRMAQASGDLTAYFSVDRMVDDLEQIYSGLDPALSGRRDPAPLVVTERP